MSLLAAAVKAYQEENYHQALALFEEAGSLYGVGLVQANIYMCRRAINLAEIDEIRAAAPSGSVEPSADSTQQVTATFFDQIYLVNIQSDVRRRLSSAAQLKRHAIPFALFTAATGESGCANDRYKAYADHPLGSLQRYSRLNRQEVARGERLINSTDASSYIETYLSILHHAKGNAFRRILILEDDIVLPPDFNAKLAGFIERVPKDWKVIHLGASQHNLKSVDESAALAVGYYSPRSLDTRSSFAIGIDSSVYDEIVDAVSAFEAPFGHLPMGKIYERHREQCHVAYPNIVVPNDADKSMPHQRHKGIHNHKTRWRKQVRGRLLPEPTLALQLTAPANLRYFDRFRDVEDAPFHLSLYVLGEDGVRPVHDAKFFELPPNHHIEKMPAATLPAADYHAIIGPDKTLTEEDVRCFLENQLLGGSLPTSLCYLPRQQFSAVSGRVSVIVPTYSRTRNLSAALESVAKQDYPDIELVVVSDNPPDTQAASEARELLDEFEQSFPSVNIKFIQHRQNRNGAAARNTGLFQSSGEFVSFLDDDDIYLPGRLSAAVAALQSEPASVGAVYCGFLGWNSPADDPQRYKTGDLTRELLLLDYKKHYLHTNTATYRRSALLRINGFDETYRRHQDLELNLRFFRYYDVGAVRCPGVRLSPEPSGVDNKLFNGNFIDLKQKFLDRFRREIIALGHGTAREVYRRHWGEVVRYVKDRGEVDAHLAQNMANGPLQVALLLNHIPNQSVP